MSAEPTLSDLPIVDFRLDNGLRVVLQPDSRLPLVAVNVWYHVGSKNEVPGKTGFAHLFEHMLFQGSAHIGTNDHFAYVQQAGGVANGSTWFDRTNYYETLPANYLDLGLWLESDRMGFLLPAMTEEKLALQQNVVMNERRQRVDNQPYGQAMERLYELLFPPGHPYRWPVIGYMEDIAAATLDDVSEFFSTYYTPANAVLTIAGDIEADDTLRRIESYFADFSGAGSPAAVPAPPLADGERSDDTLEDDVDLVRFYRSFVIPPYGEADWYAADLLATFLGDGKACPLHRVLVHEEELAQSVSAYVLPTELCSVLTFIATARPGIGAEQIGSRLEAVFRDELAKLSDDAVSVAYNKIASGRLRGLQSLDRRADLLSQQATYFGDQRRLLGELDRYQRLGVPELRRLAEGCCGKNQGARLAVVPRGGTQALG